MPVSSESARLTELKHFLRARRAALTPEDVGLPPGQRRRTPGLRRDEVAQLAGIGTTWYTFLEQGRDVRVSSRVLERLATVFSLNGAERRYLFELAAEALPDDDGAPASAMPGTLRTILDSLDPAPAYVVDHHFDMIAWNYAGSLVLDYDAATPAPMRNILRRLLLDPAKRALHRDWEANVRTTISAFRVHFSRHAQEPLMLALVEELERESAEFKRWWSQHEVLDSKRLQQIIRMAHPTLGELHARLTYLSVFGQPNLTLVVLVPEPGTRTAAAIAGALQVHRNTRK